MYRAFKIEVNNDFETILNQIDEHGTKLDKILSFTEFQAHQPMRQKLQKMIKNSSLTTKALNADSIWDEWFPEVKADVFVSHSSRDARVAKLFTDWLKKKA
jgi:hypothetical protein